LSAENLHAAFRKTVIYPFDPSAISNECVKPSEFYDNDNDIWLSSSREHHFSPSLYQLHENTHKIITGLIDKYTHV
jgi:hypothetical protein